MDLYRKQPEALRFDLYFRVYARNERLPEDQTRACSGAVEELKKKFGEIYAAAGKDGSLKTDIGEGEMFSFILNTLLFFCSRGSANLSYAEGSGCEKELSLLRDMLLRSVQTA